MDSLVAYFWNRDNVPRMRVRIFVPWMLYLVGLAAGSVWFAETAWLSVTTYRSTYALDRQFEAGTALASRVVVVVFDGLRVDRAEQLPAFRSMSRQGASGTMLVAVPSLSNPGRAAIVTGAWPEVSGVTNNSSFDPPPVQSLFGLANSQGVEVSVYGSGFWARAFGADIDGRISYPAGKPASFASTDLVAWQDRSCAEAAAVLDRSPAGLVVIGFLAADEAGHEFGGNSDGYRDVTAAVDECLGRLVEREGEDTTFVAVSDHGHIDRWGKGGHGGVEPEVIFAPFAMTGPGVRRAESIEARIVDIAPTASVLLGLPIPANNQGSVLWDALEVPADQESALRQLEQVQREALVAHLPNREQSMAAQRKQRLPFAIAAGSWFLLIGLLSLFHGRKVGSLLIAALIFAGSYYALFYFAQLGYSMSSMVRQEYIYAFLGRLVAVAAVAFGVAVVCLRRLAGPDLRRVMELSILVTSTFALLVTVTYYRHGLHMEDWMLEVGPGFKAYLDLLSILGVVLATLAAMAVGILQARKKARIS